MQSHSIKFFLVLFVREVPSLPTTNIMTDPLWTRSCQELDLVHEHNL